MLTIILAGGLGTRLAEETEVRPKPMVEVGGRPILWHIMKTYAHHGFRDFAVALGYKGETIKRFFIDYHALSGDLEVDLQTGRTTRRGGGPEPWHVHLRDTGAATVTGGRVKRLADLVAGTFMMTYGDGVSDVDIGKLVAFHRAHGKLATLTAVRPPARFGALEFDGDHVARFSEKPQTGEGWINGGFFVLEPPVLDLISGDEVHFEGYPLEELARRGQLMAYRHAGFWQPMDVLRDLKLLQSLWEAGKAPWKVWAS